VQRNVYSVVSLYAFLVKMSKILHVYLGKTYRMNSYLISGLLGLY